jgi:hypothetical protein
MIILIEKKIRVMNKQKKGEIYHDIMLAFYSGLTKYNDQ